MIKYPHKLEKIFVRLHKYGIRPIIVGGYIRDFFFARASKDIDIELYNVLSFSQLEEILKEFGSVNSVGKSFGVCKLFFEGLDLDFTLPRTDNKTGAGHKGFDVEIKADLDYKSASSRRDFTINSIGFDVIKKEILDPFNGLQDLKNSTLKAIDADSFKEDPLRVLRGVQFSARFDLNMDDKLFDLCKEMVQNQMLSQLSKERVFGEIQKLLLKAEKPSKGFVLLKKLSVLDEIPQLKLLCDAQYTKAILTLDEVAKLKIDKKTKLCLMLTVLSYSFEKKQKDFNNFKLTKEFISNWSDEKELLKHILLLLENYIYIRDISLKDVDDYFLYKLSTKVKIKELMLLANAKLKIDRDDEFEKVVKSIQEGSKKLNILEDKMPPLLQGRDILNFNIKPSKEFATILKDAYDAQMKKVFTSHSDAIIWLKKYLLYKDIMSLNCSITIL